MTKWKFLKNMQVKRFLPISILLIGLFIAFIFGGADYISLETIRTNKEELKQLVEKRIKITRQKLHNQDFEKLVKKRIDITRIKLSSNNITQ